MIEKKFIETHFKFVRTWDVTKQLPDGSVDEYEFRCVDFRCALMYYKAREWEEPHWKIEARNLRYPFREVKVDWLEDVDDLIGCLIPFSVNQEVKEFIENIKKEV